MTKAAKHFEKQLNNFWKSPDTKAYMAALSELGSSTFKSNELKVVIPGNRYMPQAGTYGHPKLAIFFARWLDVRFAVWCDLMIDNILKGNLVVDVAVPTEEALELKATTDRLQARLGLPAGQGRDTDFVVHKLHFVPVLA